MTTVRGASLPAARKGTPRSSVRLRYGVGPLRVSTPVTGAGCLQLIAVAVGIAVFTGTEALLGGLLLSEGHWWSGFATFIWGASSIAAGVAAGVGFNKFMTAGMADLGRAAKAFKDAPPKSDRGGGPSSSPRGPTWKGPIGDPGSVSYTAALGTSSASPSADLTTGEKSSESTGEPCRNCGHRDQSHYRFPGGRQGCRACDERPGVSQCNGWAS